MFEFNAVHEGRTFGLIMCARYLQQAEDTGHSSEACVGVGVLQTGDCAFQDVQHAFVHFSAHFLQTQQNKMFSQKEGTILATRQSLEP